MGRKKEEHHEYHDRKNSGSCEKAVRSPGPSGRECAAYAAAKELLSPMGEVKRTPLGSLLCCVNEGKEGAPHLLLEAHLDPDRVYCDAGGGRLFTL